MITGLLTRLIVAFAKATSSAVELRPYWVAMHSYPSACRGTINLLKHEPSAQSPWQKTVLGLVSADFDFIFSLLISFAPHWLNKTGGVTAPLHIPRPTVPRLNR